MTEDGDLCRLVLKASTADVGQSSRGKANQVHRLQSAVCSLQSGSPDEALGFTVRVVWFSAGPRLMASASA
jgi:hypothetical protein